MRTLSYDHPIILGIAGKAGTGKTTVGNILAPRTQMSNTSTMNAHDLQESNEDLQLFPQGTIWDHKFLAMPLYKLVSIKDGTEGYARDDRVLYQIHETLTDLFSGNPLYGAPPYSDLVKMVNTIGDYGIAASGKPRAFLQYVGDMCRDADPDCFVKWMRRSIYQDFIQHQTDHGRQESFKALENPDEPEEEFTYICVVSDIRFENEAQFIANEPNGVLVRFDASQEVRMDRLTRRDGQEPKDLGHRSEQMDIPEELFTEIINTDELDPLDQALDTRKILLNTFGMR